VTGGVLGEPGFPNKIFSEVKKSIKIKKIEKKWGEKRVGREQSSISAQSEQRTNENVSDRGTIQRECVCDGASGS
jgi:hypothetical protein